MTYNIGFFKLWYKEVKIPGGIILMVARLSDKVVALKGPDDKEFNSDDYLVQMMQDGYDSYNRWVRYGKKMGLPSKYNLEETYKDNPYSEFIKTLFSNCADSREIREVKNPQCIPLGGSGIKEDENKNVEKAEVENTVSQAAPINVAASPLTYMSQDPAVSDNKVFHERLNKLWREDPRKAMQTEIMMAINWRDSVEANIEDQIEELSTKYKDFADYKSAVRKYLRKLPVEQRGKPGIVEDTFQMVKLQKK